MAYPDKNDILRTLSKCITSLFCSMTNRVSTRKVLAISACVISTAISAYILWQKYKSYRKSQSEPKNVTGLVLDDGIYTGTTLNGVRHGYGLMIFASKQMYEGQWLNDKANGFGVFTFSDGSIYRGEWIDNVCKGIGEITRPTQKTVYRGQWTRDTPHGRGMEVWEDGSVYKGTYKAGKIHGKGILYSGSGGLYEGQFENFQMHGYGAYLWEDGRLYVGQWRNGEMHGRGIFRWRDGLSYDGNYETSVKEGYGILSWANGTKYAGQWSKGKQHGPGLYCRKGEVQGKMGLWEEGKRLEWLDNTARSVVNPSMMDFANSSVRTFADMYILNQPVAQGEYKWDLSEKNIKKIMQNVVFTTLGSEWSRLAGYLKSVSPSDHNSHSEKKELCDLTDGNLQMSKILDKWTTESSLNEM